MPLKIYTKTGDAGKTSLFGGARVGKDHIRIEAYGTVDELNAHLGLLSDMILKLKISNRLHEIQKTLFDLGSNLALDPSKTLKVPQVTQIKVDELEHDIDLMDEQLPALKNFILPGGHETISQAHIARAVCRRAERRVVTLSQADPVNPILIIYLNRLSDYLFIFSRYIGFKLNIEETKWNADT